MYCILKEIVCSSLSRTLFFIHSFFIHSFYNNNRISRTYPRQCTHPLQVRPPDLAGISVRREEELRTRSSSRTLHPMCKTWPPTGPPQESLLWANASYGLTETTDGSFTRSLLWAQASYGPSTRKLTIPKASRFTSVLFPTLLLHHCFRPPTPPLCLNMFRGTASNSLLEPLSMY